MRRFFLAFFFGVAIFFGIRIGIRAFASDETKIRRMVQEMAEGFDNTRMNPIMDGLAQDFLDETWGADRDLVRAGLVHMFFERKDDVTKRFLYRVEIPEQEFTVEVDGAAAKVTFLALFDEVHGDQSKLAWKAKIHAQLVKTDDGWKIRRSENESLEGTRLR